MYIYGKLHIMIRDKKDKNSMIEIDLSGPEGNAFNVLALARRLAIKLHLDKDAILDEMMSSDYEHLIQTFDKYFGDYVILYR